MNNDSGATAPRAAIVTSTPRSAPRWVAFATLGACALIPIALGSIGYVQHREAESVRQDAAKARDELKAEMQRHADMATGFTRVSTADIGTTCSGMNGEMVCTFTNPSMEAVTVCVSGKVTNKKSPGVSLSSMMLCTGRIEPLATRHMSVPWQRGRAIDLCNSPGYGRTKQLDWDECDFNYDDSPTAAPPAAAPAAAAAAKSSEWKAAL